MFNYIFSFENFLLPKLLILVFFSITLRITLNYCYQNWADTFSQTMSMLLLPVITFVVTSVIAGNIALSLGLVGALSIVRFRNPVKSSFELTIYFLCIAMGIAASVSLKWPIFLGTASVGFLLAFMILDKIFKKNFNKSLFKISFSEGNSLNVLEINSNEEINESIKEFNLISISNYDNKYIYRISSLDKNNLINKATFLHKQNKIISFNFISS